MYPRGDTFRGILELQLGAVVLELMVFGDQKKGNGSAGAVFGQLLSCDSPVEGSIHCPFLSFLSQFRPEIPLFKAPSVGPSGPPAGIRERSERDLTRVAQRFDTCCALQEFASVASEL